MQCRLTIHAELNAITGYGQHLQEILHGLHARGIFTNVRPIRMVEQFGAKVPLRIKASVVNRVQPEEWELMLCPPHHLPAAGKKVAYFTMWETTLLPAASVDVLNRATVVIVPCWWCKKNFEASGVTVPIRVVPLGVNPAIFFPVTMGGNKTCVFGVAGRLAHGEARKGLRGAIDCFREAFRHGEDVALKIKCHPDCSLPKFVDGPQIEEDPRIQVTRAHMPADDVAKWLRSLTCFVSGATGEGWGLWQHQALACGRPLIAANYGGLREYFRDTQGWEIPYYEMPAREGFTGMGLWAEPDWFKMIEAMRECYENRGLAMEKGAIASRVSEFSWDNSIQQLVELLSDLGALDKVEKVPRFAPKPYTFHNPEWRQDAWWKQSKALGWEAGKIDIPRQSGSDCAFNPGLLYSHRGYELFLRRGEQNDKGDVLNNRIERWVLDDFMRPRGVTALPIGDGEAEDCRVVPFGSATLLSYAWVSGDMIKADRGKYPTQRVAMLHNNELEWWTEPPVGRNGMPGLMEKNWVWFNHLGTWHLVYHIEPHTVYRAGVGGMFGEPYVTNQDLRFWAYGRPLNGTPPIRVGDEYWCFFHSRLPWKVERRRYFCGAYAFEAKPPFRITRMTEDPFMIGSPSDFDPGMVTQEHQPLPNCLIYPTGAVFHAADTKPAWWRVVAGVNDRYSIWFDVPHSDLEGKMRAIL